MSPLVFSVRPAASPGTLAKLDFRLHAFVDRSISCLVGKGNVRAYSVSAEERRSVGASQLPCCTTPDDPLCPCSALTCTTFELNDKRVYLG